jgi:hypothetical protein
MIIIPDNLFFFPSIQLGNEIFNPLYTPKQICLIQTKEIIMIWMLNLLLTLNGYNPETNE